MTQHCPNCLSTKLQKRGKRTGKQRYKCSQCGASFTEGVPYKHAKIYPELSDVQCPSCSSTSILRDGKLPDGTQRYRCKSCGLNFSSKTDTIKVKGYAPWECPYCGSNLSYSGYSKKGFREYICKTCGKSCTADADGKPIKRNPSFNLMNKSVTCPYCKSYDLRKTGYTKSHVNRYTCNSCNKTFSANHINRPTREELINLILSGKNISKIVEKYKYSTEHIRKVMAPYYKKESITKAQEKDIIKYGYYLKVPVDYMSEYIKCSEHKCKEILRRYKKFMSTNPCTKL